MSEAFDWKCRMVMGLESDIEDLETAGAARLNLIIRNEALEAGNSLKDRFGTPLSMVRRMAIKEPSTG